MTRTQAVARALWVAMGSPVELFDHDWRHRKFFRNEWTRYADAAIAAADGEAVPPTREDAR